MADKTIPDAAIEAAAAALVIERSGGTCELGRICDLCDCFADTDTPPGHHRDGYARDHARAALTAALPHLLAPADASDACDVCNQPPHRHTAIAYADHEWRHE